MFRPVTRVALGLGVLSLCGAASADIMYTGPMIGPGGMSGWMGTDVWYAGVSESNDQGPGGVDAPLFGAPSGVSGNSIDFNPTNFGAQVTSTGGFVTEIVDSQLSFMVIAKQGKQIDNLLLTEAGDTTVAALPSSLLTSSSVTTFIFIDVVEIDGAPVVGPPINLTAMMTFSPSGGSYDNATDGGQPYDQNGSAAVFASDWSGVAAIDFPTELAALGITPRFGVTKINVTLDNTLTVTAIGGESSFIRKKDFDGFTITTNIPEPSTLVMLALAGAGLAARRRG